MLRNETYQEREYETNCLGGRQVPDAVRVWHSERATCAGCQQRIAPDVRMVVSGISSYHESCAKKHDWGQQRARTSAPPAETIIGTIAGVALPSFGTPCFIAAREAGESGRNERFAYGCFADSIRAGGQVLKTDHLATVPGTLEIFDAGLDLRFRFRIFDTAVGRQTLEQVRRGNCAGVSVGFREHAVRGTGYNGSEVYRASLTEISLCLTGTPAWWGTSVWLEQ